MRKPCDECPFKYNSPLQYDDDAREVLEQDGLSPSCHKIVGMDSIFADLATRDTECIGYLKFKNGDEGFRSP